MRTEKEIRERLKIMAECREEAMRAAVWDGGNGNVHGIGLGARQARDADLAVTELSWVLDDDKLLKCKPQRKRR